MPDAPVAAAQAGAPAGGQQQQRGGMPPMLGMVLRMGFMWFIMSYFKGSGQKGAQVKEPQNFVFPMYSKADLVDMYVFMSEQATLPRYDMSDLVWSETGVSVASADDKRNYTFTYEPSPMVQNNGSVYLHVVFAKAGQTINTQDPDYDEMLVFGRVHNLIKYLPKPKNNTGVNLLSGEKAPEPVKEEGPREIVSFIMPNTTIQFVDHFQVYPKNGIPPQVGPHMQFAPGAKYYPLIYFNEFWVLRDYLVPVNSSLTSMQLHLELGSIGFMWWQLQLQMEQSFKMQQGMGMQQEGESDELKRVFLEGNPYLLALTSVVSLLHTVFDMLAFKNDIGFWKDNKSMEGLSARSVMINACCQLVILLYLFDNETSYVVLFSSVMGTAIEFWKVTKAMKVSVVPTFPFIKLEDRASYTKSKTKQYDEEASRYLSYALYPLVIGYSIYALMYKTHKSWYSWILSSLVGAVYMFGFILMCPQLYLNYKLKSVAHLPWRQMTYKFLNTIIDDLFAFVIKMPLLHRLSVFRDDLIFLIYLYQRWVYPTDKTRVNEFGYVEEQGQEGQAAVEGAEGAAGALPAAAGEGEPAAAEGAAGGSEESKGPARRRKGAAAAAAAEEKEESAEGAADSKKDE